MKDRYFINKLGLVNFWYYDMEEFELSSGKLLLRGSNGSGKSVTMQSFIPLLLDGNKAPDRLDPFGTKARTIGNYLLNEEDTEKTAYLYMEFKKGNNENYITIGIGLKAIKNKPLQSWYFILSDGRRINKELFLYKDAGELIPLTKKQLQNELGEGNFYTESQKSYMEAVNRYLFGFDDLEAYEELLNLLISIRSPKLSKDFKPTEIYKILTDSLKVLSDEDLRPISDSMENMDSLKDSLDESKSALKAANNIKYHYDRYNSQVLVEKGRVTLESYKNLKEAEKSKEEKSKEYEDCLSYKKTLSEELDEKESTLKIADEKYERLIDREELKSKRELESLKVRLEENLRGKLQKEEALESKKKLEVDLNRDIKVQRDATDILLIDIKKSIDEAEDLGKEIHFQQGLGLSNEDICSLKEEDITYREVAIKLYEKKLKEAEKALNDFEEQKKKLIEVTRELDSTEKDYEAEKKNMTRVEGIFLEEKEDYKVKINKVMKESTLFSLEEKEKLDIFKAVDIIDDFFHIQNCKNLLQDFVNGKINEIKSNIQLENRFIEVYLEDIEKIKEYINELKNNKEIEPERSEEVKKNRERLKESGINFIPLYRALDFSKDIEEKVKGNIESALIDMGLLDALVIDPKDKEVALKFEEGMADKYIFSDPNLMSYNLSNLLTIDKELKGNKLHEEVYNVLQSVFLDESGSTYLDEKGFYKLGILGGKTTSGYVQKYIGEASRRRHREELIKDNEEEIKNIENNIDKHKKSIELLTNDISILQREYERLPSTENIHEALKLIKELEVKLKNMDDRIIVLRNKEFEEKEKLNSIKVLVMESLDGLGDINNLKVVREVLEYIQDYKEEMNIIKVNLGKLTGTLNLLEAREEALRNILKDVDDLYYDISLITRKLKEDEIRRDAIIESLQKVDMKEIEEEIDSCLRVKRENPERIKQLSSKLGKQEERMALLQGQIKELEAIIEERIKSYNELINIFKEEYNLGYVTQNQDGDLLKICKTIVSELPSSEDKNREFYSNNLIESMNKNSGELREYNLKFINLFSNESEDKTKWLRERRDLRCKVEGKEVSFIVLLEEIKKSIEELDLLISEEEKKIFEEILMNTISQKIKAKINQSEKWVEKINALMNSMDTSSSLKLNLSWNPKKSDEEGQLDTLKIIEILKRGDRNTESDFSKLEKHFSQKIRTELRKYEGTGEVRNYHSIIKEVLDYRQWYEFKLHFVKNNERRKELTNNAFFQFSGGEKAMSMYIPLFSGIYARYEKGRGDCPRIISMDEAFAGVDENNIRDMFRLLKQLDLQYILNSQILWGDYDTVDDLSICELIREENDDVVTVLRYHWNGKEKVLLL